MTKAVLELKNIAVGYDGEAVAKGLSLQLAEREIVAIVGASGVGKSSLLRAIAGFLDPLEGSIHLGGVDVQGQPPQRRRVGMVFQDFALFSHMTVEKNVSFGLKGQPNAGARSHELMQRLGLAELADRLPAQLSGGQQQRVGLARALAPSPRLLLLDEPFAGVDPIAVIEIQRIIRFLRRSEIGVLITDHNVRETLGICDKATIINNGLVLADGSPDEIIKDENVRKIYLGEHFRL